MKPNSFLQELMEAAQKIGTIPRSPFTAERFLVALIDRVQSGNDILQAATITPEMFIVFECVTDFIKDKDAAKKALMAYICQEKTTDFLDDLYMRKKIQEASKFTTERGEGELDALTLFLCIIKEPTQTIRPLIDYAAVENAGKASGEEKKQPAETPADEEDSIILDDLDLGDVDTGYDGEGIAPLRPDPAAQKGKMDKLVADIKRIRTELKGWVFGQDNAINVFTSGYFQANMLAMIDPGRKRPRAVFLFAGPPGVGKTFLAEKAAASIKLPFMRFDMSEYSDKEANLEFCGSDKVYKNGKSGNVTSFVEKNPRCVLLFDEIEKAHINVIHLFLQMLDAGRLRDNYTDREVDFTGAIVILTTNAGRQLYEEYENGDLSGVSRKVVMSALRKDVNPESRTPYFPEALCSRFASGNVVMFNHISAENLRIIAKKELERHGANLEKETGIQLSADERVYSALLFSEGASVDARTVRGRAETFFNDELYELLRLISSDAVTTGVGDLEKIQISVDLTDAEPDIHTLFATANPSKVLTFAQEDVVERCKENARQITFVGVQNVDEAIAAARVQDVDFVLLDLRCGLRREQKQNLNMEDEVSDARAFFKYLRAFRKDLPVYLLEEEKLLNEEEKVSYTGQGVRGIMQLIPGSDAFEKQIWEVASVLYQQANMIKLARENKLVTFETAQTISQDGKAAEIKLYDFKLAVAVDSEDAKNVLSAVSKPNVRFDEVIGAEDAKKELKYFVQYLKNPKHYAGTGLKAPRGILLYGPPGTGKTMLAKALASEADVTYIAAEGNQFLKRYVGEGAEKVHELFKIARKYAPSVLFVDEIDAIAKERRGGSHASANGEEILTAFLTEMDGFASDPSKPVFVLAATNFDVEPGGEKSLDPALMRRFDRRVYIDLPNTEERIRFLKMKMANNPALQLSEELVKNIAMRATGMSLAHLDSVVDLALRSSIREGSTVVTDEIFGEAFETYNSGEVKKWDISQLERVARHEAGHALLSWLSGKTPSYLTIVARGNHGGYMQHAPEDGKAIYTMDELLGRIRTSLGGRAAEIVYYGERDGISTGASGDLASATNLAQQIVCTYGMSEDFGLAVFGGAMTDEVRAAVNRILKEQMEEAIRLIRENTDKLDALVAQLMSQNHLNGDQIVRAITKQ